MSHWKVYVGAFLSAVIGVTLVLVTWHAYVDHVTYHQLLNALTQQQSVKPVAVPAK